MLSTESDVYITVNMENGAIPRFKENPIKNTQTFA